MSGQFPERVILYIISLLIFPVVEHSNECLFIVKKSTKYIYVQKKGGIDCALKLFFY